MTLITRTEKGSKLTIEEMDGNLEYLEELAQQEIEDITYSNLVVKINGSELKPLKYYKITDFQTVHYILDGNTALADINTGSTESLIVKALSENEIDKRVVSMNHLEDIIYYDWDPDNWLDDISFGDGTNIITGFKGVIFYRKDTKQNNELFYDFRNVKLRRWKTHTSGFEYRGSDSTFPDVTSVEEYTDVHTFIDDIGNFKYDNVYNNVINKPTTKNRLINNIVYIDNGGTFYSNKMNECYNLTFRGDVYNNDLYMEMDSDNDQIIIGGIFHSNTINCVFRGITKFNGVNLLNDIKMRDCFNNEFIDWQNNTIHIQWAWDNKFRGRDNTISGNFFTDIEINSSAFRCNFLKSDYIVNIKINDRFRDNFFIGNFFSDFEINCDFEDNHFYGNYFSDFEINCEFRDNHFYGAYFYEFEINCFRFEDNSFYGSYFSDLSLTNDGRFYSNYINRIDELNINFGDRNFNNFMYNNIGSIEDTTITYTSTTNINFQKNVIGYDFNNNIITLGRGFEYNTIGNAFNNNTITTSNTDETEFKTNVIGNGFNNNTIGNSFYENIIGNWVQNNEFGDFIFSNQIGNWLSDNELGDWFINNVVDSNVKFLITSGGTEFSDSFRNNHITGLVQGGSENLIELNQPEYYENHLTTTYIRPDDVIRMKYYNNDDEIDIKSPTT